MTYLRRMFYVPFLSAAYLFCTNCFLLHLLIAGCDIGVQISVCPSFRPSVRQHLRRSLVFPTSVIAASMKPCIVIVLDIPFKHTPWAGALALYFTARWLYFLSRSLVFTSKFGFLCISDSFEFETLHSNCP